MRGRTTILLVIAVGFAFPALGGELAGVPSEVAAPNDAGASFQVLEPEPVVSPEPRAWGTTTNSYLTLGNMDFHDSLDDVWWRNQTTGWQYAQEGDGSVCAPIHLPGGSRVGSIATFTNDTNATADIRYTLRRINLTTASDEILFQWTTTGTPGVERESWTISPPIEIDNWPGAYHLCISHYALGASLQNGGAILLYKLQVSPAPATATFPDDVPTTHPFFRFVEALAGAGITGGCGTNLYCPDSPVTRGQMAVFLATALGLHWPLQ